jgi:hypothetical protein
VLANAGGVNPVACAREVRRLAPELKVAVVLGDDILDRIDELLAAGHELRNLDTAAPLSTIRADIRSANIYTGAFPLAEALAKGADVVISGRSTDTALALAPMVQRFGWTASDYDLLAAGTIAGHIVECGPQCTGGNSQVDWQSMADLANIGYPVIEAEPDGSFVITKQPRTGGRVNTDVIKEQLLYELGDPACHITADCVADFRSIQLEDCGPDRVRAFGIRGAAPTPTLKASISYFRGYKATGTLLFSWPDALEKAKVADRIVRTRLQRLGLEFEEIHTEYLGANACHQHLAPEVGDPAEVQLRIGVRGKHKASVERFTREVVPLVLSGPPGVTGYGEGRPQVKEIIAYWPALIAREEIRMRVEVVE